MFDIAIVVAIVTGFKINLMVLAVAFPGAYLLGFVALFALATLPRPLARGLETVVLALRSTPVLVQLVFVYFGLVAFGIHLDAISTAIFVFAIYYAAFFGEKFRSAYWAVGHKHAEAAFMLGLSRRRTIQSIMLPQMSLHTFPSAVNGLLGLLKDSAILSIIGIADAIQSAKVIGATNYAYFDSFVGVAILFGIVYSLIAVAAHRLRQHLECRFGGVGV